MEKTKYWRLIDTQNDSKHNWDQYLIPYCVYEQIADTKLLYGDETRLVNLDRNDLDTIPPRIMLENPTHALAMPGSNAKSYEEFEKKLQELGLADPTTVEFPFHDRALILLNREERKALSTFIRNLAIRLSQIVAE